MTRVAKVTPKNGVRLKYTGRNVGAITVVVEETGNSYPAGNNPADRYQTVYPDEVDFLLTRGFVRAPLEAQATAPVVASTGESLPNQPAEITADSGETAYWATELGLSENIVQALNEAGVTTLLAAQELTDEELDKLPGVGPATIAKIREAK